MVPPLPARRFPSNGFGMKIHTDLVYLRPPIARKQDRQNQMFHMGSKHFLFGQGPEQMQINTELMKLRSQLSEVSKQLNIPVVWYK